jgi:hypothetical protein
MTEMELKFERLNYAKKAVQATLDNANCTVDFHGLAYWAAEVERLRKELKSEL